MPSITKQQAQQFLNNINEKDKVAIIHHDDLDGFASGILLYDFCKLEDAKIKTIPLTTTETILKEISENLKEYNKIIIVDIPPFFVKNNLESLKQKQILYIDHHQKDVEISEFIKEFRTKTNEYIPASRMVYELIDNKNKEWLALAGTIADYGFAYNDNKEFINYFLEKENLTLEQYQKQVVYPISNLLIYFKEEQLKAFEILEKKESYKNLEDIKKYSEIIEKEIKRIEEDFKENKEDFGKIIFYFLKTKFALKSVIISKIGSENPNNILIFAKQDEKNLKKISLSARHQSKEANIPELLKKVTNNLKNSSSGGHLRAAGGYIQSKDLEKFKENLKKFSETIK